MRLLLLAGLLAACGGGGPAPASCQGAGKCELADGGTGACCGYGTACVDLSSDPSNCGTCADVCLSGQLCNSGACG